jgi:predicted nucleic acid-binding protein
MDRLVLDTNQIVEKDWRLRGAAMRLIEKAIAVDFILLVIPEIVVEETKNKFRQKLQKHIRDFEDTKGEV